MISYLGSLVQFSPAAGRAGRCRQISLCVDSTPCSGRAFSFSPLACGKKFICLLILDLLCRGDVILLYALCAYMICRGGPKLNCVLCVCVCVCVCVCIYSKLFRIFIFIQKHFKVSRIIDRCHKVLKANKKAGEIM